LNLNYNLATRLATTHWKVERRVILPSRHNINYN